MAEIVKCEQGHYYDREIFAECPHCKSGLPGSGGLAERRAAVARLAAEYLRAELSGTSRYVAGGQHREPPLILDQGRGLPERRFRREIPEDEDRTVGISGEERRKSYVVGWLVCVAGPAAGRSFELHYGFNTVGYGGSSVNLFGGSAEDSGSFCSVVYDDRNNEFFVVPVEAHTVFLDGGMLQDAVRLQSGARIKAGGTELEFVAFCREGRTWDSQGRCGSKESGTG